MQGGKDEFVVGIHGHGGHRNTEEGERRGGEKVGKCASLHVQINDYEVWFAFIGSRSPSHPHMSDRLLINYIVYQGFERIAMEVFP